MSMQRPQLQDKLNIVNAQMRYDVVRLN